MQLRGTAAVLITIALATLGCSGGDSPSVPEPNPVAAPTGPAPGSGPDSSLVPFPATGDLWLLEGETTSVVRIDPAGTITIEIVADEIMAATGYTEASFNDAGLAFAIDGTMYFTEAASDSVLRRSVDGTLSVLFDSDGFRDATGVESPDPEGLALGADGTVYVIEDNSGSVVAIDPSTGTATVVGTAAELGEVIAIADVEFGSNLIVGESDEVFVTTRGIPPGVLALTAGSAGRIVTSGNALGAIDGFMTRDHGGNLVMVDRDRDMIRRISTGGALSIAVTQSRLEETFGGEVRIDAGIAYDTAGNLYVADDNSESIATFDAEGNGRVWIDVAAFVAVLGVEPDLRAGIAFAPGAS